MKKNVVKAMSVGLSAITIASSLSVPVFAEESTEGGQPAEPSTASQEAETNVAEQTVVNDTAALDDTYNHGVDLPADKDAVATQIENVVDATNDAFSSDENYELEIEVVDENGNVVEDEDGNKVTETVTGNYQDTAKAIQDASDAAAMEIADAATDAELIKDAADDMDEAAANANTAVGNAESAASDVTSAVNKAKQDANAAVVAVATDSQENAATLIATAQQSVADAQQTYNEKAQDLADAKSAYADAKSDLDAATERYQDNISAAKIDLGYAETDLATLQAKVDELEKAVKQAEKALAESAAGVLASADKEYAESDKAAAATNKYIAAVVENYYLATVNPVQLAEGQTLEVTVSDAVENEDAALNLVSVTYNVLDESGAVVATNSFNLGYAINNGVVELFEKEVRYEYTTTDENGEEKLVSLNGTEIETAVTNGTAVRRYEYTDEEGKTTYLSQDQYNLKTDEEKAKYTLGYVLLGNWGDAETEGLESDTGIHKLKDGTEKTVVTVEEVATGDEATTICYFDANGNYVKVVTNYTEKRVYTYVNGESVSADGFTSEAEATTAANAALANLTDAVLKQVTSVTPYYKISGWYAPVYKETGTVTKTTIAEHYIKDVAEKAAEVERDIELKRIKDSYKSGPYREWYEAFSIPYYDYADLTFTSTNNETTTSTRTDKLKVNHYRGTASANYEVTYTEVQDAAKDYNSFKQFWDWITNNDDNVEQIISDFEETQHVVVVADDKGFNFNLVNKTFFYVKQYQLTGEILGQKFEKPEDAVAAAIAAANSANPDKTITDFNYKYSNIQTTDYYKYILDYATRTYTVDAAGANYTDTYTAGVANEYGKVYRNVQNATDLVSGYTNQINGTNTTLSNYATLLKQLADAKLAVGAAQDKVTDIQAKIDDLNKDGAILSLQVLEWELRLADAQQAYDDAKATLDDAKAALNTATQAYSDKYPAIYIPAGEPVKYPSVTTATTVEEADEEVIPDEAVPAAGQARRARRARTVAANNTTTIDEAETPLAGGDADDAVVEDTEDTTTVEEDLVPLAGETQKGFFARTWWGWLLLIIAVLTGSTAYAKKKADAKKVK
ncbi:hypothetical protein [Pseudobutyrivibrio ruminis]|uniref:Uncharacterized protein n=1 Tax=Pseudobutyrivibrio ruminis DSM 9787 TaxID=1123011 RepID=A0A285S5F2_9FIRM|nr:hypothetical protein [Pseudobutyrivibrio ruminis]SOC01954.1 hypothetical protein SAMN02910411_1844 [Pseudobutyrivibrio ruminis DSM 9787]